MSSCASYTSLAEFGHEIRDLLILACPEVAQWKGVLVANNVRPKGQYFTVKDYVKLVPALKLDGYAVSLTSFPWCEKVVPFKNWGASAPDWYEAYNGVKHNRENEFHKATLTAAMSAVCAFAVLLDAQYGDSSWQNGIAPSIKQYFEIDRPHWELKYRYSVAIDADGKVLPLTKHDYPF